MLLLLAALTGIAQELVVCSYNVRLHTDRDERKGEVWSRRCQALCDQMNFVRPDVLGVQELLPDQKRDLLAALDGYGCIGLPRDDGETKGERSAIFYRFDRVELLDSGTFWLSETPNQPSYGWDADCRRVCSWGKFRDRLTGKVFCHYNLHMDHIGVVARRESALLVMDSINHLNAGVPVVLTGDFNVAQTDPVLSTFTASGVLKDCYHAAKYRFAENGTYMGYDSGAYTDERIDHVFVSANSQVNRYGILTDCYWTGDPPVRHTISDHYPVVVTVSL